MLKRFSVGRLFLLCQFCVEDILNLVFCLWSESLKRLFLFCQLSVEEFSIRRLFLQVLSFGTWRLFMSWRGPEATFITVPSENNYFCSFYWRVLNQTFISADCEFLNLTFVYDVVMPWRGPDQDVYFRSVILWGRVWSHDQCSQPCCPTRWTRLTNRSAVSTAEGGRRTVLCLIPRTQFSTTCPCRIKGTISSLVACLSAHRKCSQLSSASLVLSVCSAHS